MTRPVVACFEWSSGYAGCPDRERLMVAVESMLGRPVFVDDHCDIVVRGRFERAGGGRFTAIASLARPNEAALGERRLESEYARCDELEGPTALVIALMVEHGDVTIRRYPPERARPARRSWRAQGSVRATVSNGVLPGWAPGQSVALGARLSSAFALGAEGAFSWPKRAVRTGAGGTFWGWHAGVYFCPVVLGRRRWELGTCGTVHGGALSATGSGLDFERTAVRPYADAEARLQGALWLGGPFSVVAGIGAGRPIARPRFVFLDERSVAVEVHRPSAFVASGWVGIGVGHTRPDRRRD